MKHASDIITDLLAGPGLTEDAKDAIRQGVHGMHCDCGPCMRAYLRAEGDPLFVRPPEPVEAR